MNKLTLQELKDMESDSIFATGVVQDSPEGINMTNSGRDLRWVACRGGIHDWAIYVQDASWPAAMVKSNGDKVTSEHNIKKLVPCDDEAFGMYRY